MKTATGVRSEATKRSEYFAFSAKNGEERSNCAARAALLLRRARRSEATMLHGQRQLQYRHLASLRAVRAATTLVGTSLRSNFSRHLASLRAARTTLPPLRLASLVAPMLYEQQLFFCESLCSSLSSQASPLRSSLRSSSLRI